MTVEEGAEQGAQGEKAGNVPVDEDVECLRNLLPDGTLRVRELRGVLQEVIEELQIGRVRQSNSAASMCSNRAILGWWYTRWRERSVWGSRTLLSSRAAQKGRRTDRCV